MRLKLSQLNENSIEELICKPLHEARMQRQLDPEEMEVIMILLAAKDDKIDELYQEIKKNSIIPEALERRQLGCFGNRLLDKKTILAIVILTDGVIGEAIQYLYYIQWWSKENKVGLPWFDFETEFCQKIFPLGVFSQETLRQIWDDTKVTDDLQKESGPHSELWCGDNLIDYQACLSSILNK